MTLFTYCTNNKALTYIFIVSFCNTLVVIKKKTEIYIKLIEIYLKSGRQVLYLLPEISLTTQIIQKLKLNFGNKISVFHSRYSLNERTEVWESINKNRESAQLIVGARSSVFLPFNDLGLIIVDEEHETSYKQQDPSPRYNARDAAIYLSKLNNSKVVLGSATPSIESASNAKNDKYGYVKLKDRFGNVKMPNIIPLDMRSEIKNSFSSIFSEKLVEEVNNTLGLGKQIILFRNRRGYSPQWICDSCGQNVMCDNCDVSLTYHLSSNMLKCHYCGFSSKAESKCNSCGSETMSYKGDGTQQIEEITKEIFPNAKSKRMDWDSTRGKFSFDKIINSFAKHEIDILIGTQMITKGLDFENVALVGVINTASPELRDSSRQKVNMSPMERKNRAANEKVGPAKKSKPFKRFEEVQDCSYSPDGRFLALGSRDNNIYVFDVKRNYRQIGCCTGHSSYITHIDWSADSTILQSNDGAYELLYWDAATAKQITSSYSLRDVAWQVWTSVLGWPVQGIWLEASDGTDVNSCCRSGQGDVIATADDYGMIRLYKFPALRGQGKGKGELPPHKAYRGHMSHVMNCRFLCNDTHLISVGGNDAAVFQWRHVNPDGSTVRTALKQASNRIISNNNVDDSNNMENSRISGSGRLRGHGRF